MRQVRLPGGTSHQINKFLRFHRSPHLSCLTSKGSLFLLPYGKVLAREIQKRKNSRLTQLFGGCAMVFAVENTEFVC